MIKIHTFFFLLFAYPLLLCSAETKQLIDSTKLAQIEQAIQDKFPHDGAGAIVWVGQHDQTLYHKAFGQAVIEFNVPMKAKNPFHIGSITKQFNAAAILLLQQQGKLSIDDNINQYFPDYPAAQQNPITIKHLLTHTAGIPSRDGMNGYSHHGIEEETFAVIYQSFKHEALEFEPGSSVNYSNNGFILLGRIVELVTGESFRDFVKNNIFTPLRMEQTRFDDPRDLILGLSKGYEVAEEGAYQIVHGRSFKASRWGSGGIITTMADMQKWLLAIDNQSLLNADSLRLMFTPYLLKNGINTKHGLGWKVANIGPYKTYEHGGNNHGFENYLLTLPDIGLKVIIATNLNRSDPGSIAEKIVSILLDIPNRKEHSVKLTPAQLDQFLGNYRYTDGTVRSIVREGEFLYSAREDGAKNKLIPFGPNLFYFERMPVYWLRFEKAQNGQGFTMYSESRASASIMAQPITK